MLFADLSVMEIGVNLWYHNKSWELKLFDKKLIVLNVHVYASFVYDVAILLLSSREIYLQSDEVCF